MATINPLTQQVICGTADIDVGKAGGMAILDANALLPSANIPFGANVGPCKYGAIQTRHPFYGGTTVTGASGLTLMLAITAETDFDFARVVFYNESTTTTYTIAATAVAASSALNDGVNPMNALGVADNTLWKAATTNNAGAFGDIPSPSGSARSVVVPVATVNTSDGSAKNFVAGMAATDWIQVQSLARSDGSNLPFLFVRSYGAGLQPSEPTPDPPGGLGWDAYAAGRIVRNNFGAGDLATTPGMTAGSVTDFGTACFVQFLSRRRGLATLSIGDSLIQGFGTASLQNDPFQIAAAAVSTPAFPIIANKLGYASMGSAVFIQSGYAVATGMKPDIIFIKADSPNDQTGGQGQAGTYEASLARGLAMADWATRQNAVPVLMTAQPWGYAGAPEIARQAFNTTIRNAGWPYIDWDLVLADPAAPNQIAAIYNSPVSPPHYNDLGSQVMAAQQIVPLLQRIKNSRPQ